MKNDKRFDIALNHQISLLGKYYDVDREKKEINVKLYYDKASELLNFSVGDIGKEMFNNEVLQKITEITDQFPSEYKANVFIVVTDFEGYTVDVLNEKLKDIIDINNYQIIKNRKYTWLTASLLVLIGFSLLLLLGVVKTNDFFGSDLKKNVFEEMINITSWVFIWQAVTILFLTHSELSRLGFKIIRTVKSISFMNNDLKILSTLSKEELLDNWDADSRIKSSKKILLLVSSTCMMDIGLLRFVHVINDCFTTEMSKIIWVDEVADLVLGVCYTFSSLGGFYKYLNKKKFRTFAKVFSILSGIAMSILFTVSIISFDIKVFVPLLVSFLVYLVFLYSIFSPDKNIKKGKIK